MAGKCLTNSDNKLLAFAAFSCTCEGATRSIIALTMLTIAEGSDKNYYHQHYF